MSEEEGKKSVREMSLVSVWCIIESGLLNLKDIIEYSMITAA